MMGDLAIENLERDLFKWWDSLTPDGPVIAPPIIQLIRRHQAAAWEDACNALAWAIDNGSSVNNAIGYVVDNNRYNTPQERLEKNVV